MIIKASFWAKHLPVILGIVSIFILELAQFSFFKAAELEKGATPSGLAVLFVAPSIMKVLANNILVFFANILLGFFLGASLGYLILVFFKARQLKTPKGILSILVILVLLPAITHTTFVHFEQKQAQLARMLVLIDAHHSSEHRDYIFRSMIAESKCDKKIVWKLINLNDPKLKLTYAQISISCNKPQAMIHKLAQSNFFSIVTIAANSPKASPETLRMIYNKYPQTEEMLLINKNTPEDILIKIANRLFNLYQNKESEPTPKDKAAILLLINHQNLPESYKDRLKQLLF